MEKWDIPLHPPENTFSSITSLRTSPLLETQKHILSQISQNISTINQLLATHFPQKEVLLSKSSLTKFTQATEFLLVL
jgi:hypothetical protein